MESSQNQHAGQHAILLGQYELTIDDANRLLIPSDVRRALQAGRPAEYLYVNVTPTNQKPSIYPSAVFESLLHQLQPAMVPDADELEFLLSSLPSSARVEIDKQGRILIPEVVLEEGQIGKSVMLVGVGHFMQLWNRDEWHSQREQRRATGSKNASRWKQAMMPQVPSAKT